ncbi:response regulator [Desulfococcaceae bacterium HSG8]|nr:response regulator [Desulfococcaceae bacterium HSG8]
MASNYKIESPDMEKKKILIVDDEMDMRIFMSTLFETSGYEPLSARDGKEGYRKAKEVIPDLVILDVMMPGEGGVQMYRHLRTDEDLRTTPVIMLSAVGKKTYTHYLKMLNVRADEPVPEPDAYLEKPPEPEELLELAKRLMRDT